MNQDYPELQQLLAGYFNQDWVEEHKNADDVIYFFISEVSTATLTKVQLELTKLILTVQTEQELQNLLFTKIGCEYYYPNEWSDGKKWLRHLSSILKKAITNQNHT